MRPETSDNPPRRATITDVAALAGVSPATVSRVLNGQSDTRVKAELAARVKSAVSELGYRPSAVARSLRKQRTKIVAVIVSEIRNPFFTAVVRGVEDRLVREGYSLVLCNSDENPEKERRYLDLAIDERMAGVILSPASTSSTHVMSVAEQGIPVVAIDRRVPDDPVDTVLVDNACGGKLATTHLLESGYTRIACITGPPETTTGADRMAGWLSALRSHPGQLDETLVRHADFREDGGRQAAAELLARAEPPDAFFVANNLMAAGVLRTISEHNLRIPQDIGVVVFDEVIWATLVQPALTTIEQPTYAFGENAAKLLVRRIAGATDAPERIVLKPTIRIRGSSRRPGGPRSASPGHPPPG